MATYIIIDRAFNVVSTGSAKDVMGLIGTRATRMVAPGAADTAKPEEQLELSVSVSGTETLSKEITVKGREVFYGDDLVANIEGARANSSKGVHTPYSMLFLNGHSVGGYDYLKDILAAIKSGELDSYISGALTAPTQSVDVEIEEPSDTNKVEITLPLLRKVLYKEPSCLLYTEGSDEWTLKIHVHH